MGIVSGIVLFAVIWFMVLFIVLPIRLETQGDRGEIVPGTHAGAPADFNMRKKARLVTLISVAVWIVLAAIIFSGVISVRDFDWYDRMGPTPRSGGTGG
jgi:predicted secreted protein